MIALALALLGCAPDLSQPAPVAYDRAACDACAMLISDPRFAAQLVTRDGERLEFDDPACLFRYVMDHKPAIANIWFHDSTDPAPDAWIHWAGVGFVPTKGAPMAGGWGAVPAGTAGAVSFGEASSRVLGGAR